MISSRISGAGLAVIQGYKPGTVRKPSIQIGVIERLTPELRHNNWNRLITQRREIKAYNVTKEINVLHLKWNMNT